MNLTQSLRINNESIPYTLDTTSINVIGNLSKSTLKDN